MRGLLVAFGLIVGLLSPAFAGDYDLPILRGSQSLAPVAPVTTVGPATFTRWSGFYFGGAFSYGSAHSDFSTASQPLVHFSLQHTTVEDKINLRILWCSAKEAVLRRAWQAFSVTIFNGRT